MRDDGNAVGALDYNLRVLESLGSISGPFLFRFLGAVPGGREVFFLHDVRQRFVLNLYGAGGVFRKLLVFGGERDDFESGPLHLGAGPVNHVHPLHSRHLFRGARVDRDDFRVRVRRTHDGAVEHARPLDVLRVLGFARDLVRTVKPGDPLAHERSF